MTVSEKPTMPHSKALEIAREARGALLNRLAELLGCPIEAGQLDGDGVPLTNKRVRELRRLGTRAGMSALRSSHTIIPDNK